MCKDGFHLTDYSGWSMLQPTRTPVAANTLLIASMKMGIIPHGRTEGNGIIVPDITIGEVPVHLVIHHIQFLFSITSSLFSSITISQISSSSSFRKVVPVGFCGEQRDSDACCTYGTNICNGRHKVGFGCSFNNDMLTGYEMSVVVIIPAWHCINDLIAFVAHRP